MRKKSSIAALILLSALVGCSSQPGKTMLRYQTGKIPPPPTEADVTAMYVLFPNNTRNPIYRSELVRGEEYGFRKKGDAVVAFARDREIPLDVPSATSYAWKIWKER
jgi:hypothetical protein